MEDYRLPASLFGMLKATRLTGNPRVQTDLQATALAVAITWDLATSTTKKKTKKPDFKKTASAKKPSSTATKSSTPPTPVSGHSSRRTCDHSASSSAIEHSSVLAFGPANLRITFLQHPLPSMHNLLLLCFATHLWNLVK